MMKKSDQALIEFNPKLPLLNKNEIEALNLLVVAAKLIVPLYKLQENRRFSGANFYPHDTTREEIKKAANKDPQILSPFTVVERINGELVATPYHKKYAELLRPIADKLEEAADITENKEFGKVLRMQAKALVDGTYEQATIARLKMKPYILDISIGPMDYFDDQLFFTKASYQAWVGVLDEKATKKFSYYKNIIISTRRKGLIPSERLDSNKNVKTTVLDVILFSGLLSRTKFVGVNIQNDLNIVEKYGSEIVLFKQANDLRVAEQILPTFNKIFSKGFKEGFKEKDLKRGNIDYIALHELAHSYLRYRNAAKNLQDLLPYIEELGATTLGIRVCGSLLLRDLVTTKQLESMIIAFLCRSFYLVKNRKADKSMINYTLGGAIFINFMLKSGALKQLEGMAIPNFTKIFVALHELSSILERILSYGTRKDAEVFIKKYGQLHKVL